MNHDTWSCTSLSVLKWKMGMLKFSFFIFLITIFLSFQNFISSTSYMSCLEISFVRSITFLVVGKLRSYLESVPSKFI